jgi:nucleoside phosphorylase
MAAFEPELAALRATLGPRLAVGDVALTARTVGIGLAAAALGASAQLRAALPRAAVLVGTCGAYARDERAAPAIGDVVVASAIRLMDAGALSRVSEFPPLLATSCAIDERLGAGIAGDRLRRVQVATTLAITVDDAAAKVVGRAGAEVEHLEAFSVALACADVGVAFAAVLGVANIVGSKAREQWRENHVRAAEAAATEVVRWLQSGAVGLAPVAD